MGIHVILITLFLAPISFFAQGGCTDPQATNYNPNALQNDGSCNYPITPYSLNLIGTLNDVIQENSGLIRLGNFLYTFNDSGAGAQLFELDTLGVLLRTITVAGATNIDWEAISVNSSHLFIGDVGNNLGNRNDLCIYRIAKNTLHQDTVQAEKMMFYWNDQTQFTPQSNANNYDCEAFIAREDSLVLFSKNWVNLQTRRYTLPVFWNDTIPALLVDSFNVDGLITDACFDPILQEAYLLGYKNNGSNFYTSFIWCLSDYSNDRYFNGNKRRIEIGNVLNVSQTEGIALYAARKGYVSSEKVVSAITLAPKLFRFDFTVFFESLAALPSMEVGNPFTIFHDPAKEWVEIILNGTFQPCSLHDLQGKDIAVERSSNHLTTYHHGLAILTLRTTTTLLNLP
ncbi:MAG: hypothetical protein ACKO4Y_09015 [Flavobacteriales bacterium]